LGVRRRVGDVTFGALCAAAEPKDTEPVEDVDFRSLDDDADSRPEAREGRVLDGKWSLERRLGQGGMAAVYLARHRNGARAAVKILHPQLARHPEVRERFLREGYAANRVDHPGAVRVLDDDVVSEGPDKGIAYLVMELLEGESLHDRLGRGPPMNELEFLRLAQSVLEVLDAAHAHGVVHRDIKPENLFLVGASSAAHGPQVKILDFGFARLLRNETITSAGVALGTPSFMSPEQAAGRIQDIDGRTDLFALAATGFRVRAGRRVHEAESPVEIVTKMAKVPAPRLATVAPGVSRPFARVIDRGLEFRREDRYSTAASMARDVRLAIQELEAGGVATRVAKPPAPPPPIPRAAKERKDPSAPTLELDSDVLALQRAPEPQVDDPVRIPKRRSVLPWVVLVVVAGVGGRLWGEKAWEVARAQWAAVLSGLTAREMGASQDAAPLASASSDGGVAAPAAQADDESGPPVSAGAITTDDGGGATTDDDGDATTDDGAEGGDATTDAASDVEVDAPLMGATTDSDGSADAAPGDAADGG
jgi:serine/threonine-protein kinase